MIVTSHQLRLDQLVKSRLKQLALNDILTGEVNGPCYVMGPDPAGRMGLQVGWVVMVTLKHNVLLGQPDIGVAVPIAGVLPPDEVFNKAAEFLLEEARKLRHQESSAKPLVIQGEVQDELPLGIPKLAVGR